MRRSRARSALLGLLGIVTTVFLTVAGAAGEPSQYVPARSGGWPGWLAGPLEGLGMSLGSSGFQTLMLIMCASYALVLASRARCRCARWWLRSSPRMWSCCSGRR